MKYRITEGENCVDGAVIFRIYRDDYLIGAETSLGAAQKRLERILRPKEEKTVVEFEA